MLSTQRIPIFELDVLQDDDSDIQQQAAADVVPAQNKIKLKGFGGEGDRLYFLPNTLPIYGMQHCIDNLTKAVHESLTHWPSFLAELNNFESLLMKDGRKDRFMSSCLIGNLENSRGRVRNFHKNLYEARWREVVGFLKHLKLVLPVLRQGFDADKYVRGVDGKPDDDVDASSSKSRFDPHALAKTLRSHMFNRYMDLILSVEGIPTKYLASWSEGCTCHEPLTHKLSDHVRHVLIEKHYGKGFTECPAAGLRADLLAGGKHLQVPVRSACSFSF